MSAAERIVSATEFKAKCLEIMNALASGRLRKVTVTKRGKPAVVVSPAPKSKTPKREPFAHGFMKGSVIIPEGLDLTEPIFEGEIDAAKGILHR